jgi:hypothetical protein
MKYRSGQEILVGDLIAFVESDYPAGLVVSVNQPHDKDYPSIFILMADGRLVCWFDVYGVKLYRRSPNDHGYWSARQVLHDWKAG